VLAVHRKRIVVTALLKGIFRRLLCFDQEQTLFGQRSTMMRHTALVFLATLATAVAFAPSQQPSRSSSLQFKFLKELGLEKPAWLPDFGGKKEEEAPVAEVEGEDGEESESRED